MSDDPILVGIIRGGIISGIHQPSYIAAKHIARAIEKEYTLLPKNLKEGIAVKTVDD